MTKLYNVTLSQNECEILNEAASKEKSLKSTHSKILLLSNQGLIDSEIAKQLKISIPTVARVRKEFVTKGLYSAITFKDSVVTNKSKKYNTIFSNTLKQDVLFLLSTNPPIGKKRWNSRLLAESLIESGKVQKVSRGTVYNLLKKLELTKA